MENDALRSGLIFKLKGKELEKVRSPPVVKFNTPATDKPAKSNVDQQLKDTFNEIYRQTPVPRMALSNRNDRPQLSSSGMNPPYSRPTEPMRQEPTERSYYRNNNDSYGDDFNDNDNYSNEPESQPISKAPSISIRQSGSSTQQRPPQAPVPMDRPHSAPIKDSPNAPLPRATTSTAPQVARGSSAPPPRSVSTSVAAGTVGARVGPPPASRVGGAGGAGVSRAGLSRANCVDSLSLLAERLIPLSTSHLQQQQKVQPQGRSVSEGRGRVLQATGTTSVTTSSSALSAPIVQATRPAPTTTQPPAQAQVQQKQQTNKAQNPITHRLVPTSSGTAQDSASENRAADSSRPRPKAKVAQETDTSDTDAVVAPPKKRGRPRKIPLAAADGTAAASTRPAVKSKPTAKKVSAVQTESSAAESSASGKETNSSGESSSASDSDEGRETGKRRRVGKKRKVVVTRSGRQSIPKKIIPLLVEEERLERAEKSSPKRATKVRKIAADKTLAATAAAASASSDTAAPTTAPIAAPITATATTGTTGTTGTTARASKAAASKAQTAYNHESALKETADESGWTPAGMVALFNVQGKISLHAPNFWDLVSDAMADMGFEKTAQECQQKWFQKVEDTKLRRERKAQQDKIRNQQKSAAAAAGKVVAGGSEVTANGAGGAESSVPETTSGTTTATAASTAVVEEEAPKAKRMGNRELKRLAQESSKASREDDIFDSGAMGSYWSEVPDLYAFELLSQEMLVDMDLPVTVDAHSSSGAGAAAEGEEEIVFASSHVHKLNYKPPAKFGSRPAPSGKAGSRKSLPHSSSGSGGGVGKLMDARTGKVNADGVKRQARQEARGGAQYVGDSEEEEEDGEESGSTGDDDSDASTESQI